MSPLRFNRPRRHRRRRNRYQVCIRDQAIYAKVFQAHSPQHAMSLASIDTEQNRDWRNDWELVGGVGEIASDITIMTPGVEVQP